VGLCIYSSNDKRYRKASPLDESNVRPRTAFLFCSWSRMKRKMITETTNWPAVSSELRLLLLLLRHGSSWPFWWVGARPFITNCMSIHGLLYVGHPLVAEPWNCKPSTFHWRNQSDCPNRIYCFFFALIQRACLCRGIRAYSERTAMVSLSVFLSMRGLHVYYIDPLLNYSVQAHMNTG
jgi:hypothetical protein